MGSQALREAVRAIRDWSVSEGRPSSMKPVSPEEFGSRAFNDQIQRDRLPKPVYQALRRTIQKGEPLDVTIADTVAAAMKDWAMEHGATHYTHWFQPMTGITAEKHDAFLV